jgi:protein gp37
MATRHCDASTRGGRWSGEVVLFPERLAQPLHWRKPSVVAVQFMGDLFHERVPFEFIAAVFGVMAACPQHTFLLLTKRPERMARFHDWLEYQQPTGQSLLECCSRALQYDSEDGLLHRKRCADPDGPWPLPNAWLGISAENQPTLEARWNHLRQVPAAHYWLSIEPLLGPVTSAHLQSSRTTHVSLDVAGALRNKSFYGLSGEDGRMLGKREAQRELERLASEGVKMVPSHGCNDFDPAHGCRGHQNPGVDFVAVGPETGPKRRPCDVAWIRSVVQQCRDAHVPVHVKALEVDGIISHDPREWPQDLRVRDEVPW